MEEIKKEKSKLLNRIIVIAASILVLLFGMFFDEVNQFLAGGGVIAGAVCVYFLAVFKTNDKNYLSFSAVFNAVWIATIGLAQLRLLGYQKIWSDRTWLNLMLASVLFQIAIPLGHAAADKLSGRFYRGQALQVGRIKFEFKAQRLFWICLFATILASALFVWNISIKGYVPFFTTRFNAYITFYTKRMVFVTAACVTSPIAYWCIKKCNLSVLKKIILYLCIAINTFIIPILQVNRGVFIVASLMLTAAIFYLNGKKFLVMVVCLLVTFGFYEIASTARNYSSEYLEAIFEPVEFVTNIEAPPSEEPTTDLEKPSEADPEHPTKPGNQTDAENPTAPENPTDTENEAPTVSFQLPPKLMFLYGYFTVSHDNFNEAINHATRYSYGVRQLAPFNVILRSSLIEDALSDVEYYTVKSDLNTTNLISGVYYDLREFGVVLFVLLWGFALGIIEKIYLKYNGVFALATLGNALTPVVLSFFAPWFENFTLWLFWGTILLIMLLASIRVSSKKNGGKQL